MHRYKDLKVWQKAMDLVVIVYTIVSKFPPNEQYGLSSQMKRAAVSIVSNIAEGSKRQTKKDFKYFLSMSFGSGAELETQLEIARRLLIVDEGDFVKMDTLLQEVMRMLSTFITKITND